jgi:hypothetical protein
MVFTLQYPSISLNIFLIRSVTTEGDIAVAEQSLSRVRKDLRDRREALQRHEASKVANNLFKVFLCG